MILPKHMIAVKRLGAAAIDWGILIAWGGGLFLLAGTRLSNWFQMSASRAELSGFVLLTMPLLLYLTMSEVFYGATFGKKLCGLKVADVRGQPLTARQVLARNILKLAPWELAHFSIWHSFVFPHDSLASLGYIALAGCYITAGVYVVTLFIGSGRTAYDRICGTHVLLVQHPKDS